MSWFSTLDGLVWGHLTNAPTFSVSRCARYTRETTLNAQMTTFCTWNDVLVPRTHIARSVYHSLGDVFSCFVYTSVYLFIVLFLAAVRKSQQYEQRFSRTEANKIMPLRCKSLTLSLTPPPLTLNNTFGYVGSR